MSKFEALVPANMIVRKSYASPATAIASYKPRANLCPHYPLVADMCREITTAMDPSTARSAINTITALAQLFEWGAQQGMPLDPKLLLRPTTLERWGKDKNGDLANTYRLDQAIRLRSAGRMVVPEEWAPRRATAWKPKKQPPYTLDELSRYWFSAHHQTTQKQRRFFIGLLALTLGAGLKSAEVASARPEHLVTIDGVLCLRTGIKDSTARLVPIRLEHIQTLQGLAKEFPDEPFIGNFTVRLDEPLARIRYLIKVPDALPPLKANRLRNTWLVSILDSGVDIPTFLQIAGLQQTRALGDLKPYLSMQAASLLRATGATQ